jgi:hypothetical protein
VHAGVRGAALPQARLACLPRAGRPGDPPPRKFLAGLRDELTAFARHEFRLSAAQPDGLPLRVHLEAAWKRTRRRPKELDGPRLRPSLLYLWEWYVALDRQRGSSGFGAAPLGYPAIEAWARLVGARPTPWELECLTALDLEFLASRAEAQRRQAASAAPKGAGRRH